MTIFQTSKISQINKLSGTLVKLPAMINEVTKDCFKNFNVEECKEAISLLKTRIKHLTSKRKAFDRTIEDLNLSPRAYNVAKSAGIETVRDILIKGESFLYFQPGGGIKTVREILEKAGLSHLAWKHF